jgi:putative endonuclease
MSYYVYIIYSPRLHYFYKGSTDDPLRRLKEHNDGRNKSTANKGPWELVFVRHFDSKQVAQREERRIKRTNPAYLQWLIDQPFNELGNFQAALSRLD